MRPSVHSWRQRKLASQGLVEKHPVPQQATRIPRMNAAEASELLQRDLSEQHPVIITGETCAPVHRLRSKLHLVLG